MSLPTVTRFVHPDIVSSHFHFREGDRVADFGAGSGTFIRALAKAVGETGRVYACEIRKNLVEMVGAHLLEWQLRNVDTLWCDFEEKNGTNLKGGMLDGGILVNTLFQLENKEEAFREMSRVLRKGGKLFVIDWTDSFNGLGPHQEQIVTTAVAQSLAEKNNLYLERTFPAGDHHYGLAFRKT